MRATTRYKAWWTEKWMWGSPWLQELWTWVDCSIRLTMHTSSELRNPRPRYDNKYISSCEMLSFFEALHNSYCPHLLWAHLQTILVSWYNSHLLMLLQTFLLIPINALEKASSWLRRKFLECIQEKLFIFFLDLFLAWVLPSRYCGGLLLDGAGIFLDGRQILKIIWKEQYLTAL